MTNEEYYIRSTDAKRKIICEMYDCEKCPLNFMNEYTQFPNGELIPVNDGCWDFDAVNKWLGEEHKDDN